MIFHVRKKRALFLSILFLAGIFLVSASGWAQAHKPPKSFVNKVKEVDMIDTVEMHFDPLSLPMNQEERVGPKHVAQPMQLNLSMDDAGTWETLPDGGTLWRLRVNSLNAHFLSYKFSRFALPEGAELYFVSAYRDFQVGPFTHRHNQATGRFGSPVIAGDAAIIELYLPQGSCAVELTLESVSHGFKNALGMGGFPYRQTPEALEKQRGMQQLLSGTRAKPGNFDCQRDINCPEGADYQNEKRAVSEGYDGAYVCSGQLINNVRQDNRYLYLTAGHCGWYEDPSTMSYYWNYENTGCGTNDYPEWTYSTGSTDLYHVDTNDDDINLLELHGTDLEGQYNIYFMGWNRGSSVPSSSAMISHPDDKPKQIVLRYSPIIDCAVGSCSGGWGDNFWRVTSWDVGVDEGGSSGGGLMDQNHLVVGTLTGGVGTDCDDFAWDEFYKLSAAWTQLQPFLDPDNTGAMLVAGKDGSIIVNGPATNPSPADGATDVAIDATLSWTAGAGSDSSDVYFGTNPNPGAGEFQGNQTGTTFDPGTLAYDTTYYWRVDAVSGQDVITGSVWSFTTGSEVTGDTVTIVKAEWKQSRDELYVVATSSSQPDVTLTVVGYAAMTFKRDKYEFKQRPLPYPATVTVTSSGGGSATASVTIK